MANFEKAKPSQWYSIISIAIVMFLLGVFMLLFLHANNLTNIVKEQMNVVVELDNNAQNTAILKKVQSIADIKNGSVQLIAKEQALETMQKSTGVSLNLDENPFLDVITFRIEAKNYSDSRLAEIKSSIAAMDGVTSVVSDNSTISNIKTNLKKVAFIILQVGLIFVFLALVILKNTISLSMISDKREIQTMKLVGAKWNFIKMPYIKSSVNAGIKAWLITILAIALVFIAIYLNNPDFFSVVNFLYVATTIAALLGLSVLIPALTANTVTNSYLKAK